MFQFLQNRIFISLLLVLALGFFLYNAKNFKLDASSDTLILQNDKDFKFFNFYNNIFPSRNFLILAVKSNKLIDEEYIDQINKLKNNLESIKGIDSTFSIVDAPILISNNIGLNDLASSDISTINNSKIPIKSILDEFSKSPIFNNQLISEDKKISSIIIYPKIPTKFIEIKNKRDSVLTSNNNIDSDEIKTILYEYGNEKEKYFKNRNILIKNIRNILDKKEIKYEYYLGGIDMIADDTIGYVKNDIYTFSITVTLFLIIILYIIFREIKWVIIPLVTTFYSIIVMIGLNGFLNWEITAISANFISLMLILSVSMNIHIINNYRINKFNEDRKNNLNKTLAIMFFPCLYTALTTIVAFGSLIFSDIKPIIDFGKIMIVSLLVIFITSFTILPLLISYFPKIKREENFTIKNLINRFQILYNYKIIIISINSILIVFSIIGIRNLNVENSFINYFKKNTEIHKGMKIIDEELGGTTPLDIIIKFKNENDNFDLINDDEDLEMELDLDGSIFNENNDSSFWLTDEKIDIIQEIHNYLENKSEIGKVQSIYSLIKTAEQINRDKLSYFELSVLYENIPDNYKKQLISPYLSIDENMIKISSRVKDSYDINRNELIKEIKDYLTNRYEIIEEVKVNGLLVLYNNMLQSLFSSQIKSFGIVLLLIFMMFLILFKSIKLSVVGILPNILASSFILGLIGLLKIPLDIMTITIAAITIGIAVDNTIHYLYRFKKNYLSVDSINETLKFSHNTVGHAILITSITIALGFSVLCLSNFVPTIFFGLFTSLAMILAMVGVLITLPAIILIFYKKS